MSKTVPECPTCPMEEPRPGFYRCKKCGYEKDYRRKLSAEHRFYIGAQVILVTVYGGVLPCVWHQRAMGWGLAFTGLCFVELVAMYIWVCKGK